TRSATRCSEGRRRRWPAVWLASPIQVSTLSIRLAARVRFSWRSSFCSEEQSAGNASAKNCDRIIGNMHGPRRPWREMLTLGILLACSPRAFALDPSLDISQYAHTSWRVRDGFFQGIITSMAQTRAGYLWGGTDSRPFRFEGVRAVLWQPPGQNLPSNTINRLYTGRDGALWIGTAKGLASWKDG